MKVALVTGGSEGIGKAIAAKIGQQNYRVVIAARSEDKLAETVRSLTAEGITINAKTLDVREPQQVQQVVKEVINEFGSIDLLVNNAGIYSSGPAEEFSLEDWHKVLDTNLWGYIHTIHATLPHMVSRESGKIVNICSIAGKVPMPYLVPYTTSKHAIAGLSQSLGAEVADKGIQVSAIYPNIIKTTFPEKAVMRGKNQNDKEARYEQLEQTLSMPFIEKPEDVANAVWQVVGSGERERVPGSAKLMNGMNSLLPQATQWMLKTVFKNKDS